MAVTIPQVNTAPSGDTFTVLFQRFNQVANLMSNQVVTSSANATGGVTTGNVQISGILSSSLVAANTLRGGSVAVPGNLEVTSNVQITTGQFSVGNSSANTTINSSAFAVNNAVIQNLVVTTLSLGSAVSIGGYVDSYFTTSTSNTVNQPIDSFPIASYRSAEYNLQVRDSANNVHLSKLLVVSDGIDAFMTEYGIITSNNSLGVFSASANATSVILSFLPVLANNTIRAVRRTIVV